MKSEDVYFFGSSYQNSLSYDEAAKKSVLYYINRAKASLCDAVTDFLPNDNGNLILSFVLGEKSGLSEKVQNDFRVCGISHLMAVSGLHLYTWSHAILIVLIAFFSRKRASLAAMVFTLFFMVLTGFTPSVVRAGVLVFVAYVGYVLQKSPDSLNSLGLALLIMCAVNPYVVHNISFQLSFSAAFGLSLTSEKLSKIEINFNRFTKLGKFLEFICRTAAVCLVATAFTLPAVVYSFGKLSLMCVIANILCIEISMFVMMIGATGALLAVFRYSEFIGIPLILMAGFLSKIILWIVGFLGKFDFLYVNVDSVYVKVCVAVLIAAAAALFAVYPKAYKNKKLVALGAFNLILLSVIITSAVLTVTEVS